MSSAPDEDIFDFIGEALPILSDCEIALLQWEQAPNSKNILDHIFRCFHSLKGISCLFDFEQVDHFIHNAESLLGFIRAGKLAINSETITAFLKVINALRIVLKNLQKHGDYDDEAEDYEILLTELRLKTLQKQAEGGLNAGVQPQTEDVVFVAPPSSPFIRIQSRELEQIVQLVHQLEQKQTHLSEQKTQEEIVRLIAQVKEHLVLLQKKPISDICERLPLMVRQFALSQNKQIHFELSGGNILVATNILEVITDPITHLIRNSMDHGIETIDQRQAAGKSSEGRILLRTEQKDGALHVEICDDGRGIDPKLVLESALAQNFITAEESKSLSSEQIYNLLLLPGFSTAQKVSRISGRGVGLNIVKTNLDKIGGQLLFKSNFGHGTKIEMIIPDSLKMNS